MIKVVYKILGINIGKKCQFKGIPIIFSKKRKSINIGDNVRINSSLLSNLIGLYCRTIIVARNKDSTIDIGSFCGLSGVTIYARKSIKIGEYTKVGANTKIIDNDFHPVDPNDRLRGSLDSIKSKPVIIGKNVFIGCNSIILKGTVIGDNCVIGAGSVVSGVFPSNVVICGNPAKIVREIERSE